MAGPRRARLPVGSGPWISEERSSAMQITQSEVEEFSFSARNDFDWLNEHMADIFSENQINVAEIFKTPGKLRGKTPRTVRKINAGEARIPLSDIFSATPKGAPNPFAIPNINRNNSPRIEIAADPQPSPSKKAAPASPLKHVAAPKPAAPKQPASMIDSGYHGSQSQDAMDIDHPIMDDEATLPFSQQANSQEDYMNIHSSDDHPQLDSSTRHSMNPTVETNMGDADTQYFTAHVAATASSAKIDVHHESTTPAGSPLRSPSHASLRKSPMKSPAATYMLSSPREHGAEIDAMETVLEEPSRSSSDSPSPIRPIVRKSSLNFASLPERQPITQKSIGNRVSRTSHLDQNRTSYYNRYTGGKSLGRAKHDLTDEENDDMDIDDDADDDVDDPFTGKSQSQAVQDNATVHNKTYTQRLQDQISKLGQPQTQASRSSKSIPDQSVAQSMVPTTQASQSSSQTKPLPPLKHTTTTPGSFPTDDEDDWIQPLGTPENASDARSPRPGLAKSYTADVMEGVSGKMTVGGGDFAVPKTRQPQNNPKSPERPSALEQTGKALGHHKSVSVPVLPFQGSTDGEDLSLKKTISVSNPSLAIVPETEGPTTPMKSPSRGFKDSPLKQVKNKLSSILKSSKGLLASSAAISAEGKTSLLSPSTTRLGLHTIASSESLASPRRMEAQPLYPDLSRHATEQTIASVASPTRTDSRRTRASIEREKAEEKRKEREAKEARRMAEQMEKLEKAREKEREKARVFSKEQERVAAMEKQLATQKEQEKKTMQTPANPSKSGLASPRKPVKAQPAIASSDDNQTDDIDMLDAPTTMPPPSVPRSAIPPPSVTKGREIKRPTRPAKEPIVKSKQAPTVIRVNMGSQHPQYQPSNNALASSLHETLAQPQSKLKSSQPALQTKPSLQSLKSSTSSSGRPKALEAAARRKEQEEREAQRKRDAKAEIERKRAAIQEEERRQEQQRKAEAERQREEDRKQAAMQAEAKKNAQRQAMLEKAKQTRAPPPAARSQPNGPPDYSRPPSRLATNAQRSQEDAGRPVNAVLSTASKANTKRPLQPDHNDDGTRQTAARGGTTYQSKESKRIRMTDEFDDEAEMEKQPSLKGAPVRPSGGYKKELPTKSMFQSGYANASLNGSRDLFKATVTNQHNSHMKVAHPLDMTQLSKGPIPFAPNPNAAGPSYKTPARPQGVAGGKSTAKSATRSSPRFQNGESIELPEINTDDEDDSDEGGGGDMIASWADSPNLRQALVEQEGMDPFQVFGAPAPLNMEEVFAKSKDRFHKFRARTSSANWSGSDRLTEEDIRKDLAARDKLRRDGGWSYEMSRDMV
ncbi:uncharacterized protein GGS22DRAFT_64683 [Annulohypoxylon maeteangense]|uniref:uncharacterized protein n=1 Tax=Annulohypoxylon maeteangense TaxID=1927788 RepID=UPI002008D5EF|nr:uncharacterized protein GGS22DRAFT_64683 [Annulohypoxylon maeteangense]KAI0888913.1 hypothetical protein GGS22DRAFT_64683 [Annulohypoxylon maeteangense]